MTPDEPEWNELERQYAQRLLALFAQVDPQKPEKGVKTLLLRARKDAEAQGLSLAESLEAMYRAAQVRTERRVRLLQSCPANRQPPAAPDT